LGFFGASSLFEHVLCSFLAHLVLDLFCSICLQKCASLMHNPSHIKCIFCFATRIAVAFWGRIVWIVFVPWRPCVNGLLPSASAISRTRCRQRSHSPLTLFCLWISYPSASMALLPSILYCFRSYVTCVPSWPFSLYQLKAFKETFTDIGNRLGLLQRTIICPICI
jgi:hypothetical protein